VEAQANSEEAVVSKTARVTGEVVVKKDAKQRTESVSDTVRSTKVDVEDERTPANRR
jgi:stress response protein YsnF